MLIPETKSFDVDCFAIPLYKLEALGLAHLSLQEICQQYLSSGVSYTPAIRRITVKFRYAYCQSTENALRG